MESSIEEKNNTKIDNYEINLNEIAINTPIIDVKLLMMASQKEKKDDNKYFSNIYSLMFLSNKD